MRLYFFSGYISYRSALVLFALAYCIRAFVFYAWIYPREYYRQPDSFDYHYCALNIAQGYGMYHPSIKKPIFWRTPGYPLYLVPFYLVKRSSGAQFSDYRTVHKAALTVQVFLSSCIPLIIYCLAFLFTHSSLVAWLAAGIATVHPGLVLASTYLLTDSLATLFFLLFVFFLPIGLVPSTMLTSTLSALSLSIFTWMRPMGIYIACIAALLILCGYTRSFVRSLLFSMLFLTIFISTLTPWYIRNYTLTGSWFFCPQMGPYLQTFIAPKIARTITNKPLRECLRRFNIQVKQEIEYREQQLIAQRSPYSVCTELVCLSVALPWIINYPFYTLKEWLKEVIKTSGDLYSSQIVAFAYNTWSWDPPEEFLLEKVAAALFNPTLSRYIRALAWLELVYILLLWIGLIGGSILFFIYALYTRQAKAAFYQWFVVLVLISSVLGMTGGYGYARLRLPIEGLMLIISLQFWYTLVNNYILPTKK